MSREQGVEGQNRFFEVCTAAPGGSELNAINSDVPRVMLPHADTAVARSATATH
ncbi:hypothetical protein JCM2811A_06250 [Methylorubrum rhodinum]